MIDILNKYNDINLIDLANDCNAGNIQSLFLTRNSNEIASLAAQNERAVSDEGIPHKLYNKISENGVCENEFRYKSKIETAHGTIYFGDNEGILTLDYPMEGKLSQNSSNEEIEAL